MADNSNNTNTDLGKRITDTVKAALQEGDLNRLKDIGPVVQHVVEENIPVLQTRDKQNPAVQQPQPRQTPVQPAQQMQSGLSWLGGSSSRKQRVGGLKGVAPIALGAVGVVIFAIALLITGVLGLTGVVSGSTTGLMLVLLGGMAASIAGIVSGVGTRALLGRAAVYMRVLSDKGVATYEELAAVVGKNAKQVQKDIKKLMQKAIVPQMRTDTQNTCVMLGDEVYQQYLAAEKSKQQREAEEAEKQQRMQNPATANIEVFKEEGAKAMARMKTVSGELQEKEVAQKIDTLSSTAAKIFAYVEKTPQKLPETRKFMSYYLPTTLRLIEEYLRFEKNKVQLTNVEKTKKEIEDMLGTLDTAFNNLLESLYQDDTLDISTDIEVLSNMLEQEGLMGEKFVLDADANQPPIHLQ